MLGRGFVFLLALFVAIAIGFSGTKLIMGLLSRQPEVMFNNFKENLKESFGEIEYGDVREIRLTVPTQITKVCFFDNSTSLERLPGAQAWDLSNPIIKEMALDGENVFLLHKDSLVDHLYIRGIKVKDKVLRCFDTTSGVLNLRAEGWDYGTVLIS